MQRAASPRTTPRDLRAPGSRAGAALRAFALSLVVVVVEYVARHVVAPLAPTIADPVVDDMAATGAAYALLSLAVARAVGAGGIGGAIVGIASCVRRWEAWVGGGAALAAVILLARVDAALWGQVVLPSLSLPRRAGALLLDWAWLKPAALLYVNGLVIPVAEEWLWRGVIQRRFERATGGVAAIGVTAVLFSLKHAVVDASLGRLVALVACGVVLGVVARRATWKASAVAHALMNVVATALMLVSGLVAAPACLSPEPAASPELASARERALALIDTRDRHEIEALFTPEFLARIPPEKVAAFYETLHTHYGSCTWQCTTRQKSERSVQGRLACTRGSPYAGIAVEAAASHRVEYLVVSPLASMVR